MMEIADIDVIHCHCEIVWSQLPRLSLSRSFFRCGARLLHCIPGNSERLSVVTAIYLCESYQVAWKSSRHIKVMQMRQPEPVYQQCRAQKRNWEVIRSNVQMEEAKTSSNERLLRDCRRNQRVADDHKQEKNSYPWTCQVDMLNLFC